MTGPRLMLEGNVDNRDEVIRSLSQENSDLKRQVRSLEIDLGRTRQQNVTAITELRQLLLPFYRGLQAVFGEMEAIGGEPGAAPQASNARWESWKQRMPGRPAEFIDLLLVHGSMSVKQFMAAAHCGKNTVYQTVSRMGQAGIVVQNSGRYSLKES